MDAVLRRGSRRAFHRCIEVGKLIMSDEADLPSPLNRADMSRNRVPCLLDRRRYILFFQFRQADVTLLNRDFAPGQCVGDRIQALLGGRYQRGQVFLGFSGKRSKER